MTNLRVLYVVQSARMYGSQRCLIDILVGLQGRGIEPVVAIKEEGPLTEALKEIGVPFHVIGLRNWLNNRNLYQSWRKQLLNQIYSRKLSLLARLQNADLIHTNTFIVSIGAMAAKKIGIPHVWHAREELRPHRGRVFVQSDEKVKSLVADTTAAVLTPSHTNRAWLKPYVPADLLLPIPDGPFDETSKQPFLGKPAIVGRQANIAVIGRLGAVKGTEDALKATALLKERGINARWTLVGSGHEGYAEKLQNMAKQLGVSDLVTLAGYQGDVERYYREADLVVMPSYAETFGRVTAEALGYGCPLVASRIPATQEIVDEGRSGLLFEAGDVAGMADEITRIIQEPALGMSLASHGYEDVWSKYTRQIHGERISKVYRDILS